MVQTFQELLFNNKCYAVELLKNNQDAHLTQRIYIDFSPFFKKVKIHEHSSLPYSDFVLWFLVYTYPSVVH